jgi:hypothetical protein
MWVLLGSMFLFVGGVMMFRGWNYSLRPDGPRALKRKARNVELGFPTDMKLFGRKVRRLGTIVFLVGAALASIPLWSGAPPAPAQDAPPPAAP